MPTLDADQISYLENVLGIRSILWPSHLSERPVEAAPRTEYVQVQTRGSIDSARLIVAWQRDGTRGSEAEVLMEKMIAAMKVSLGDVYWVEWDAAGGDLPAEVTQSLERESLPPVLIFGERTAEKLVPVRIGPGRWVDYRGGRYLMTLSPEELLESAEKKKLAWAHLQAVMKVLKS